MYRFSRNVLTVTLLCASSVVLAQSQEPQSNNPDQAQAPQVTPPSPSSSPQDLELRGDTLRARKDYLDAIDYYKAAMHKMTQPTCTTSLASLSCKC